MRPLAVFTIVQNELRHLQNWLGVYGLQVPASDIYVLDHETTGDAADAMVEMCQAAGVQNLIPVSHDHSYDGHWLTQVTRHFQQFLLGSYETVLFCAADEIVLPTEGKLTDFLAKKGNEGVWVPQGYEVIHRKDEEEAIVWENRLIPQRTHCYPCRWYSKPCLARYALYWHQGWVRATNVPQTVERDPGLALLHLHRIDYDECLRSHREKAARTWKPEERKEGFFRHNLIEEPEMLSRWMLSNADDTSQYAQLVEIPPAFKEFC